MKHICEALTPNPHTTHKQGWLQRVRLSQKGWKSSAKISIRARPDWAYEFPDRTGSNSQICQTGHAEPD
jgi:hypothetical protein